MTVKAIFFGAIGTLAETSDIQRRAFNAAFAEAGLDWYWSERDYREMLHAPGGAARIESHAQAQGDTVDAAALHRAKELHFERLVKREGIIPRASVCEVIGWAKSQGMGVAMVTTTSTDTISLVLGGLTPSITRSDFDLITDRSQVSQGKPASEVYDLALQKMGLDASDVLAVEDTPESASAAVGAGIRTIGFPGWAADGRDFPDGVETVRVLTPDAFQANVSLAAE